MLTFGGCPLGMSFIVSNVFTFFLNRVNRNVGNKESSGYVQIGCLRIHQLSAIFRRGELQDLDGFSGDNQEANFRHVPMLHTFQISERNTNTGAS